MSDAIQMIKKFAIPVRVYFEDTDAGGIVFYANYLKFFERARTEWLRSIGVQKSTVFQSTPGLQSSHLFVVKSAHIDYQAPARLDDMLKVTADIQKIAPASITFQQEVWRASTRLVRAEILLACVAAQTFRPCRLPFDF